jgi:hypothetical protein
MSERSLHAGQVDVICRIRSRVAYIVFSACVVCKYLPTDMLDNVQIAILTKVNDLAERFGIRSHEFVAVLDNANSSTMILRYEVPPSENQTKVEAYNRMLDLLGAPLSGHEIRGTPGHIIEALDKALELAPRERPYRH